MIGKLKGKLHFPARKRAKKKHGPLFGSPLAQALDFSSSSIDGEAVPSVVAACIKYIDLDLELEGLFRVSGSAARIKMMRESFDIDPAGEAVIEETALDAHDAAALLKLYLRELPDPLFPSLLLDDFGAILRLGTHTARMKELKRLMEEIPVAEMSLLRALKSFLLRVSSMSHVNKMTTANLALVFAPNVFRAQIADMDSFNAFAGVGVVEFGPDIFQLWLEMEEKEEVEEAPSEGDLDVANETETTESSTSEEEEEDEDSEAQEQVFRDISVEEAIEIAAKNLHAWNVERKREDSGSESESEYTSDDDDEDEDIYTRMSLHDSGAVMAMNSVDDSLTGVERRLVEHQRRMEQERQWKAKQRQLAALESKEAGEGAAPSMIGTWMSRNRNAASRLASLEDTAKAKSQVREQEKVKDEKEIRLRVKAEIDRLRHDPERLRVDSSLSSSSSGDGDEESFLSLPITACEGQGDEMVWFPWYVPAAGGYSMMAGLGFGGNWAPKHRLRPAKINVVGHETVAESYTEYVCAVTLTPSDGSEADVIVKEVRRRYSEIRALHLALTRRLGDEHALPRFPPRRFFNLNNLDPSFVEGRAADLHCYLQAILDIPTVGQSDIVLKMLAV